MDALALAVGAVLGAALAALVTATALLVGRGRRPRQTTRPATGAPPADAEQRDATPARLAADGGRDPKLVLAYVRPDVLEEVKAALSAVGAPSLTVVNVSGRGSQPAKTGQWRGEEYTVDLHQKVKVECVVADVPAEDVMEAIADAARTGRPGDGKVFVLPVEAALQIRTGKRGPEAV